jgi:hypothetical protein
MRNTFFADPPRGTYYFDYRDAPINTQAFGNMELVIEPNTVNAGARFLSGFEMFADTSRVLAGGSLPTG